MPEGPELRYMSEYVNKHAKHGKHVFHKITTSTLATNPRKHPPIVIPKSWKAGFTMTAESRGKEMKIHLRDAKNQVETISLLIRAGMSGNFMYKEPDDEFEKHAHLRFLDETNAAICFVDYRRFGSWHVNEDWGPPSERGPDIMFDFDNFVQNLGENLELPLFKRPICEVMLDQRFFNGIGNYLRAEILHRAGIHPFLSAHKTITAALEQIGWKPSQQQQQVVDAQNSETKNTQKKKTTKSQAHAVEQAEELKAEQHHEPEIKRENASEDNHGELQQAEKVGKPKRGRGRPSKSKVQYTETKAEEQQQQQQQQQHEQPAKIEALDTTIVSIKIEPHDDSVAAHTVGISNETEEEENTTIADRRRRLSRSAKKLAFTPINSTPMQTKRVKQPVKQDEVAGAKGSESLVESTAVTEKLTFLPACRVIMLESLDILRKDGFTSDADRQSFSNWLQCYMKLDQTTDNIGRTIWFSKDIATPAGVKLPNPVNKNANRSKSRLRAPQQELDEKEDAQVGDENLEETKAFKKKSSAKPKMKNNITLAKRRKQVHSSNEEEEEAESGDEEQPGSQENPKRKRLDTDPSTPIKKFLLPFW